MSESAHELGRLLAEVDFTKTLVIFVGDNGVPPPVKDTATGLRDAKGSNPCAGRASFCRSCAHGDGCAGPDAGRANAY